MSKKYCPVTINCFNQLKQTLSFLIGYDQEPFLNVIY